MKLSISHVLGLLLPSLVAGQVSTQFGAHFYAYYPASALPAGAGQLQAAQFAASTSQCGVTGHLADLTSQGEAEAIGAFVMQNVPARAIAWIGLTDEDVEGSFKWSDGSMLGYTNWNVGSEPEPNGGQSEDCVFISPAAGKWSDYGCLQPGAGVLVEYDCPPVVTATVLGHHFEYYQAGPATGTWQQAVLAASQMHKCGVQGHLATITSKAENDGIVAAILPTALAGQRDIWIGLNDLETEGTFEWVTGEAVTFATWNTISEPNGGLKENCVDIVHFSGRWNDVPCFAILGALVEFDCPTPEPSSAPSALPSKAPTMLPSLQPSSTPSVSPTILPSASPSAKPSLRPSAAPSRTPSAAPTTYAFSVRMCYRNTMIKSNCGCSNTDGFACFKQVSRSVCQDGLDKSLLINTKAEYDAFFDATDKVYLSQCNVP